MINDGHRYISFLKSVPKHVMPEYKNHGFVVYLTTNSEKAVSFDYLSFEVARAG